MLSALLMYVVMHLFSWCEQADVHVESFVVCVLCSWQNGMAREKRSGRGGQSKDAWPVKYESIELCCPQRIESVLNSTLLSEIVKLNFSMEVETAAAFANYTRSDVIVWSPYIHIHLQQP